MTQNCLKILYDSFTAYLAGTILGITCWNILKKYEQGFGFIYLCQAVKSTFFMYLLVEVCIFTSFTMTNMPI